MAELAGLDAAVPWRSYIGGPEPRALGRQRLFYMMARQVLDEAQWRRVLAAMREAGARFDTTIPRPPAPRHPAIPRRPRPPRSTSSACCWSAAAAPSMKWSSCASSRTSSTRPASAAVRRAYYDSDIDLCRFTLADDPTTGEAARDRIFDAARKTITRFEFGGRIYQGGIPPESDG